MPQQKCCVTGCTKWSFQDGQCKDHYKPPSDPRLSKAASGDGDIVKSGGSKEEVILPQTSVLKLIRAMSVDQVSTPSLEARASSAPAGMHKRYESQAFIAMNEDKAIKSQIDADIAARVKKLGNKKKKLTGGEAPPPPPKSKGILGSLFSHDSGKTAQAPSRDEIKRQQGLRGTSAAAIAEMNQKGLIKGATAPTINTAVSPTTSSPSPSSASSAPPSPSPRPSSPSPRPSSPSPRRFSRTRRSSTTPAVTPIIPSSPSSSSSSVSATPLFSADLVTVCEGNKLPMALQCMMDRIQEHHDTSGLFRISGSSDEINALIASLNANWKTFTTQQCEACLKNHDIHTLTGAFKNFWRKIPEPLFPFAVYPNLLRCAEAKDADGILSIFNKLPAPRLQVAQSVFAFLASISRHSEVNMMTPMNLSICFAPNLIRPKQDTMDTIVQDTPKVISCVCVIIEYFVDL